MENLFTAWRPAKYWRFVVDPVSMLVAALLAGAAAGATSAATDAVKDAYKGLRGMVQRAFAGKPAEHVLESAEKKPDAYKGALEEEIRESGIAEDPEVHAAAEKLLDQLKQAGLSTGDSYTVTTHDQSRVGAVGPNANVTMGDSRPSHPRP